MSAEDELGLPVARRFAAEPDAAELARFWDDTASDDANIRIISWWLDYAGTCNPDETELQQFSYRHPHYNEDRCGG